MNEISFSHACGESNYHIVFSPKYWHEIFDENDLKNRGPEIKRFCAQSFIRTAEKYGMKIRTMRLMPDHVHMFVGLRPDQSVAWAVQMFKGRASFELFRAQEWLRDWDVGNKRFWGGHFWSNGYFFRSVGCTINEAVDFYIRVSQDRELRGKYYTIAGGYQEDPYVTHLKEQMRKSQMKLADFA